MIEDHDPYDTNNHCVLVQGAPLRMMVMYAEVPLNSVNYNVEVKPEGGFDVSTWFKGDKPGLKDKNPLTNLPYVVDGDIVVSQTNACFSYLGRKFNLWGANVVDSIRCDELLCEVMDLRNKMVQFSYGNHVSIADAATALLNEVSSPNGILKKLELFAQRNAPVGGGCFMISNAATAPDFHLWEMLDQYKVLAKTFDLTCPLADLPALAEFHEKFAALPGNARYLQSKLYKLPFNNKSASFCSVPGGGRFVAGVTECGWADVNGLY